MTYAEIKAIYKYITIYGAKGRNTMHNQQLRLYIYRVKFNEHVLGSPR